MEVLLKEVQGMKERRAKKIRSWSSLLRSERIRSDRSSSFYGAMSEKSLISFTDNIRSFFAPQNHLHLRYGKV